MPSDIEAQEEDLTGTGTSTAELPRGYPRYSALLSADSAFQNFRKFTRVRMRILLAMQDGICQLEDKLDRIDRRETWLLFHACMRKDKNKERLKALAELRTALREYDAMIEDTRRSLSLPSPDKRELRDLRQWLRGTGRLDSAECAYLDQEGDLGNLTGSTDRAVKIAENFVEDCVAQTSELLGDRFPFLKYECSTKTPGDELFILGPAMRNMSRIIAVSVVTLVLLLPTLALPRLSGMAERATVSVIAAAMVLVAVGFLTRARTIELVACGASYVAVIVALTSTENVAMELRSSVVGSGGNITVQVA